MLLVGAFIIGCATEPKGPAYGREREFRQQVEGSVPVKDWGYQIRELRFSTDYRKALVRFVVPAQTNLTGASADFQNALARFAMPGETNITEVILEDDGFRRYRASLTDYVRIERAKPAVGPGTPGFERSSRADWQNALFRAYESGKAFLWVTFPDTEGPAYRHEPEFRRQLADSVPVKDWGYKIQEIRFSSDFRQALVVCLEPGTAKPHEFTLKDDGFRRFRGSVTPYDAEGNPQFNSTVIVTVTLPDK